MIHLHNISVLQRRRFVLHALSLYLARGDSLALVAPEPEQQDSLIRILTGQITPSAGTATLQGRAVAHTCVARALIGAFSVRENIQLLARLNAMDPVYYCAEIDDLCGFGPRLNDPLHCFSARDRRRFVHAATIALRADILIQSDPGLSDTAHAAHTARCDAFLARRQHRFVDIRLYPTAAIPAHPHNRWAVFIGPDLIACDTRAQITEIIDLAKFKEPALYA